MHGVTALEEDQALTAQAQTHAESLFANQDPDDLFHSEGFSNEQYGESIFWKFELSEYQYEEGSVVTQWYAEGENYNFEQGTPIEPEDIT